MGHEDDQLLGSTPIDLGAALFSLHDPHPGHERDFNRYYERDHMYAAALLAPFRDPPDHALRFLEDR